jgi:carbon monoxide dehydrogenase subunit G
MRTVERFITSARPETVWRVLADVENWHSWTPTVIEIKALSNKELTAGARYRVSQPKLRPAIYEVTECIPNERFTWAYRLPGGAMVADHRLVFANGETEVELSVSSNGLLADFVGALFSKTIREYVATEARCLKHKCESIY